MTDERRPRRQSKENHFLSQADKTVLDAGADPYASLDEQRRSEKKVERERHQKRYWQVVAQTAARSSAALTDLWWLASTLDKDFVKKVFMREVRPRVTALEILLFQVVGRIGWEPVPGEAGGVGEHYSERLASAMSAALSSPERRVRVVIMLEGVEGPLSHAQPLAQREERRKRSRSREPEKDGRA